MKNIAKFLYEMGQLKRVRRSGWWIAGIDDPESVAEHSFRTAIIGYILAKLTGANLLRTTTMCLFHDTQEARLTDLHRVAQRYLKGNLAENLALQEQLARLPSEFAEELGEMAIEEVSGKTLESKLARDADSLECMIQAIEYRNRGFVDTEDWISNCRNGLQHPVSIEIAEACLSTLPREWWDGLKINKSTTNDASI